MNEEIENAKFIFNSIKKMYPEIPAFPLKFKNLGFKGGGYLETIKFKSKRIGVVDMVIDTSGNYSYEPDYVVCHEYAHVILAHIKHSLKHNKMHEKLTYKLAKKFNLV